MNNLANFVQKELPSINQFLENLASGLDPTIAPVAHHVLMAGGKRLRPLLTILSAGVAGYHNDDIYPLACSIELLHSATLLHDDILDGASLRRGKKTAHEVFGLTPSILVGDALLALANRLVADYGKPRLTACLSEALLRTATGEIKEIAHIRKTDLSHDDYLDIITGKTAYLIQAACQSGALIADAPADMEEALAEFGLNLGITFQLVDDALDYTSNEEISGKPSGGDLKEGKLTLPFISYLESLPEKQRLQVTQDFETDALDNETIATLVSAVVEGGFADTTRRIAKTYLDKAVSALSRLPDVPERELMRLAMQTMLDREK
ncbi:polyprenyl synthetase family protein [Desulfovibrio inopinatus]|uniref:polyprenyl synthetase family protein n=1 Tax=Desulfovibrio inopinatus TaxID=102109 RepID=UPI0003FB7BF5|nr:polyprenyl synthetase family protein [Desulfovibrio inopinatus]